MIYLSSFFNNLLDSYQFIVFYIDSKLNLGLQLDESILDEFEKRIKHVNFSFSKGIDFIHEFFKTDNKFNNQISKILVKPIIYNKSLKNLIIEIANKGLLL